MKNIILPCVVAILTVIALNAGPAQATSHAHQSSKPHQPNHPNRGGQVHRNAG